MKCNKKTKILLSIFGLVMLGFTTSTVFEYFRYRDGIPVQSTITDISSFGRRRYRADIAATIEGTHITERIQIPRRGTLIAGTQTPAILIKTGDVIEMLAIPTKDGYDMAIADDVRNPWTELGWEVFTLFLIIFCIAHVPHDKKKA